MSRAQKIEEKNRRVREIVDSTQDEAEQIKEIAQIRGWFRPEANSPYYPTIRSHLKGDINLSQAEAKLFEPIDSKIAAKRLDDVDFMELWYSILLSARQTPCCAEEKHTSILNIVLAFKKHSIPDNDKYNYLYSSLTDFGMACREAYNDTPTPANAVAVENTSWASLNYFLALTTAKDVEDLSMFAIWAMRQGLEEKHADDEEGTAVQKYDTYVPAAAAWVSGMNRKLFEKEQNLEPDNDNQGSPGQGGELWTGKAEFSKARWDFWKNRFAEVGKSADVAEKTRTVAKDAVEAMERAATFEHVAH